MFYVNVNKFVVYCRRDKFDIYIGRPSKWENPFKRCSPKPCHGDTLAKIANITKPELKILRKRFNDFCLKRAFERAFSSSEQLQKIKIE